MYFNLSVKKYVLKKVVFIQERKKRKHMSYFSVTCLNRGAFQYNRQGSHSKFLPCHPLAAAEDGNLRQCSFSPSCCYDVRVPSFTGCHTRVNILTSLESSLKNPWLYGKEDIRITENTWRRRKFSEKENMSSVNLISMSFFYSLQKVRSSCTEVIQSRILAIVSGWIYPSPQAVWDLWNLASVC